MPVLPAAQAARFGVHGAEFTSYAAPSRGSRELCAWRLDVPAGLGGTPHRPDREEVLLVLDGALVVTLDGDRCEVGPGEVVLVPPGALFQVDGGPAGGSAWVTTTPGLTATLPDGSTLAPPWAH